MKKLLASILLAGLLFSPISVGYAAKEDDIETMNLLLKLAGQYTARGLMPGPFVEMGIQLEHLSAADEMIVKLNELKATGQYTESDLIPFVEEIYRIYRPIEV